MKIEIISGPDEHGKYVYWKEWYDEHPASCLVCGANPDKQCGHYGPGMKGQIFVGHIKEARP